MTGSEQSRSPSAKTAHTDRIRTLNDQFRRSFLGGRVMLTPGVTDLAGSSLPSLLLLVRNFDCFEPRNDPYGEHDFGALEWEGETIFWKIDYYDPDLLMGSPDPSDPAVTCRVLTIMLAGEY